MDILTKRINKLLRENKISMYKMAKDFNCSKATITNWCYGYNEPKATEIKKIANYFAVSADYLLGLEDETGSKTTNIKDSFNNNSGNLNVKL